MACCDSRRLQSVWRSRFPPSSFSIFRSSLPLWRFGPVGLVHSLPSSFPLFSSFSSFFFLFFSFFLRSSCVRHRPVSSVYPSAFAPYIQTLPRFTEFLLMVAGRYGGSLGPYSKMSRFFFVAPPGDRCLGRISVGPESDRSVLPSFFTGFPAPRPHRVHLFLLGTSGSLPSFDSDGGLPSLFCCCCCCLVFFSALPFEIHQPTSSRAGPFSLYTQATSEVWNRVLLGFHRLGLVATGFRSVPRCVSLRSLFFPSRVDRVVFFSLSGCTAAPQRVLSYWQAYSKSQPAGARYRVVTGFYRRVVSTILSASLVFFYSLRFFLCRSLSDVLCGCRGLVRRKKNGENRRRPPVGGRFTRWRHISGTDPPCRSKRANGNSRNRRLSFLCLHVLHFHTNTTALVCTQKKETGSELLGT